MSCIGRISVVTIRPTIATTITPASTSAKRTHLEMQLAVQRPNHCEGGVICASPAL